jgi:di/tripeptidase
MLAQWMTARSKQLEFDLQDRQRRADREDARVAQALEERRSIYARLNTSARQYTQELRAYLRLISSDEVTDDGRSVLAGARQAYRDLYSEAQMIMPDGVLEAAALASEGLAAMYGTARRLDASHSQGREAEIEAAREYCRGELYDLIANMRQVMREDLGVSGDVHHPGPDGT